MEDISAKDRRIYTLSEFIKVTAFDTGAKMPETVIDNLEDWIFHACGAFIWRLNPVYGNVVCGQEFPD